MLIDVLKLHLKNVRPVGRDKILFFQDLSSQIPFSRNLVLMSSSSVPIRFKSSIYTAIIANPISNFLMKMHGHIRLFTYPSFSKYSLRRLYHMRPDCFNPYKDHCNLIEYMLRGFVVFASGNLNPSGIFMYIIIYGFV